MIFLQRTTKCTLLLVSCLENVININERVRRIFNVFIIIYFYFNMVWWVSKSVHVELFYKLEKSYENLLYYKFFWVKIP